MVTHRDINVDEASKQRFYNMVHEMMHPTAVMDSRIVKVHDFEVPHIGIVNDNERVVRY